jgi:hypothetical protein
VAAIAVKSAAIDFDTVRHEIDRAVAGAGGPLMRSPRSRRPAAPGKMSSAESMRNPTPRLGEKAIARRIFGFGRRAEPGIGGTAMLPHF